MAELENSNNTTKEKIAWIFHRLPIGARMVFACTDYWTFQENHITKLSKMALFYMMMLENHIYMKDTKKDMYIITKKNLDIKTLAKIVPEHPDVVLGYLRDDYNQINEYVEISDMLQGKESVKFEQLFKMAIQEIEDFNENIKKNLSKN